MSAKQEAKSISVRRLAERVYTAYLYSNGFPNAPQPIVSLFRADGIRFRDEQQGRTLGRLVMEEMRTFHVILGCFLVEQLHMVAAKMERGANGMSSRCKSARFAISQRHLLDIVAQDALEGGIVG